MADLSSTDATILFVGAPSLEGDAVTSELTTRGAMVEWTALSTARDVAFVLAPDLIVLFDQSASAIAKLAADGVDGDIPVVLVAPDVEERQAAKEKGARAVRPREPVPLADALLRALRGEGEDSEPPIAAASADDKTPIPTPEPVKLPPRAASVRPSQAPKGAFGPAVPSPAFDAARPKLAGLRSAVARPPVPSPQAKRVNAPRVAPPPRPESERPKRPVSVPPPAIVMEPSPDQAPPTPIPQQRFSRPAGSIPPVALSPPAAPARAVPAPIPRTAIVDATSVTPVVDAASDGDSGKDDWAALPSFGGAVAAAPAPPPDAAAPVPIIAPPALPPSPAPTINTPGLTAAAEPGEPAAPPAHAAPSAPSEPPPASGYQPMKLAIAALAGLVVVLLAAWFLAGPTPDPIPEPRPPAPALPPPVIEPDAGPPPDVPPDAPALAGERTIAEQIDELINVGNYNRTHGALDRAEEAYRSVVSIDARNQRALVGLTRVALARHDTTTALTWARTLTREHSRSSANFVLLGDVLAASGNRDEARRAYQQALTLAPGSETARERLDGL